MSNPNEYVTHGELNEILSAIGEMFERSENRMMSFIEKGVQKQVNILGEAVEHLTVRQTATENQLGLLTESVQEMNLRLDRVEERLARVEGDVKELKTDMRTVKAIVSEHDEKIITLRRAK